MLQALLNALLPRAQMSEVEFNNSSESQLLIEIVTSQVTYYGLAGVGITLLYKFFPKLYLKLHRYGECRTILQYGKPQMFLRGMTEVAIEYGMCALGRKQIPWMASTFPSAAHAFVAWNSTWPTLFFSGKWFLGHTLNLFPSQCKSIILSAPASALTGCMFSGNDVGSLARPFYEIATGTHPRPTKRAIIDFFATYIGRVAISALCGWTTSKIERGAWYRVGSITTWFIIDIFALRAIVIPKLLDAVAPFEVDGVKLELPPETEAIRPFEDEEEEAEARTELMGFSAEQMQHVNRFCWEIIISEHCRGSVKAMATKWLRYSQLLHEGTTNEGVTDMEEIGRVASVYENNTDELDTHGVDDEHRTCAVCLVDFEKADKIATIRRCGHTFHLACVEQWWSQHNNCPCCREELLREQSNGSFSENPAGGAEGAAANGQQQEGGAAAAPQVDPVRQVYDRLFKMAMQERTSDPSFEWGPLKTLFYNLGMEKGVNAVRELMQFDPEMQLQQSGYDLWHVIIVNLTFNLPTWD